MSTNQRPNYERYAVNRQVCQINESEKQLKQHSNYNLKTMNRTLTAMRTRPIHNITIESIEIHEIYFYFKLILGL